MCSKIANNKAFAKMSDASDNFFFKPQNPQSWSCNRMTAGSLIGFLKPLDLDAPHQQQIPKMRQRSSDCWEQSLSWTVTDLVFQRFGVRTWKSYTAAVPAEMHFLHESTHQRAASVQKWMKTHRRLWEIKWRGVRHRSLSAHQVNLECCTWITY